MPTVSHKAQCAAKASSLTRGIPITGHTHKSCSQSCFMSYLRVRYRFRVCFALCCSQHECLILSIVSITISDN